PAQVLQLPVVVDHALHDRLDGEAERERDPEDNAGMAEGEEEADAHRLAPLLKQLPSRVVDRRDVVGVEGVAQPEAIGQEPQAKQSRVAWRLQEQKAPANEVEQGDNAEKAPEAEPLATVEVLRNRAKNRSHAAPPWCIGRPVKTTTRCERMQ